MQSQRHVCQPALDHALRQLRVGVRDRCGIGASSPNKPGERSSPLTWLSQGMEGGRAGRAREGLRLQGGTWAVGWVGLYA